MQISISEVYLGPLFICSLHFFGTVGSTLSIEVCWWVLSACFLAPRFSLGHPGSLKDRLDFMHGYTYRIPVLLPFRQLWCYRKSCSLTSTTSTHTQSPGRGSNLVRWHRTSKFYLLITYLLLLKRVLSASLNYLILDDMNVIQLKY